METGCMPHRQTDQGSLIQFNGGADSGWTTPRSSSGSMPDPDAQDSKQPHVRATHWRTGNGKAPRRSAILSSGPGGQAGGVRCSTGREVREGEG